MYESYFNLPFTLIFKFHMSSTFHLIYCTNCKFKYESWWKLLTYVYQWINMIISVIQFPNVTLCFAWKLFQLAISLLFSNFFLFIVQTANSKYESWWKLLMEVYQWINMIISVIQFPNVTLCFAWKLFQLAICSHYLFHMSSTFHLIYCTNCKFKYESWWKLLTYVYQWINMIISVIQFPNVTLCFAWKLFQLAICSHYLFHMSSTFHLI